MNSVSSSSNGSEGVGARWSLRLLGTFELSVLPAGERIVLPGKRERVLLAYLALSPNCRQQRRKLVTLLWGDTADETTLDNLRNCLWNLRKALGDSEHQFVASDGEDIVLDAAAFEVDALSFRRLAAQSDLPELEQAAHLCSGEFLDGLVIESEEFESWRRAEGYRYRDQVIDVLTRLMTLLSECGEGECASQMGERILRLEPLHEAAVRRLMRHYSECGRRGAAIQLYRTFAEGLRTQHDAYPEAETRLVFAELASGGEERTSNAVAADAKPRSPTVARPNDARHTSERPASRLRPPLAILAAALVAVIGLLSYQPSALFPTTEGVTAGRSSAVQASGISIAVLPFVNLSSDAGQEFFSDGMTEEITAALAKVPNLRVVARTSAYQFKGQNRDLRIVGQALGTNHLIEGSVRKVGDRVRITAQLIKVDDGTHLWTESYDSELTDIFKIQEEIAQAIAGALRVPLGLAPGGSLVSNRSIDPESYQQYLHAKALLQVQGTGAQKGALPILEPLVVRNPNYAPAWALLAQAYGAAVVTTIRTASRDEARRVGEELAPKQDAAARRAIELDPNLAEGYLALGSAGLNRRNLLLREELISKALALDSDNQLALGIYGNLLAGVGRLKEALAARQRVRTLEPFVPASNSNLADSLWLDGQNDAALALLKDTPGWIPRAETARIYASMGRYSEAADAEFEISSMSVPTGTAAIATESARLLRMAPAKVASPPDLLRLEYMGWVYLHIGAPGRALEQYEKEGEAGFFSLPSISVLWHPSYAPVRKTERFKDYVRKAGLVDYWRVKGWPEFCRPKGADNFVCV
jgi:adenylate cyclase